METAAIHSYAIQFHYERQTTFFAAKEEEAVGGSRQNLAYLTATESFEFSIAIQQQSAPELTTQADVAAFIKGLDIDLYLLQHNGRPIYEFSPEEAAELVSEDGYWGMGQTAARLAEFVLNGAGDDLEKLRAGRAGIIKGFKEAEEIWGGTLPEISYQTQENALGTIDERIKELDGNLIEAVA